MRALLVIPLVLAVGGSSADELSYPIVDTGQIRCYDNKTEIAFPPSGSAFFGQDAHYTGRQPAYKDNGDGTVTDLNTRLMWTQDPGNKKTFDQAVAGASLCRVAGYTDWRLPTIKELYSLILFTGTDPDPMGADTSNLRPFIDADYFKFQYGRPEDGDRIIDSQFATCTKYLSTTMGGNKTMFGVNFADGRIKGYPISTPSNMPGRPEKTFYCLYVRGNSTYGKNDFVDNGDGTVTDKATGLMWMKVDSGSPDAGGRGPMSWQQALAFAESLEYAGYDDWRLPNVKELQSIADYSRCPDVTQSAAIDPVFEVTAITNGGGERDYPCYWTGTSHCRVSDAEAADYVAFGRALGWMRDHRTFRMQLQDVHGAGAQRSDPKLGDPSQFPQGRGPQGDVIRIYNFVRCVRAGTADPCTSGPPIEMKYRRQSAANGEAGPMQGRGPSGEDLIRRLDRDGDGRISRLEFDGPADHFNRLDTDADGYLSAQEASQIPPPARRGGPNR